ncbi:MAG: radical SAM protein [Candidatus Azambacteria bacterium]|nr:radical SAM protein [Candidatus Azambacteria bacterium]
MKFEQSPFLHVISVDDEYIALYNSLNLEVAFLKKDFIKQYQQEQVFISSDATSERILEQLEGLGLLIKERADGYELYREYQKALDEPAINILYLLLSDACNIRCRYCYFLAPMPHGYQSSLMKKETAIKALDLFTHCVKRSITKGHPEQHIVIYGGEPTLNKEVLLEVLQYIDRLKAKKLLPGKLPITVNTNGILLDKEILTQCKATEVVVAISVDGPKEIHDQMRVYSSGKGTFDEVMRSYRLAQQMGVKTGICVTIDRHNLFRMKEIVRWLADELGAKGMGFNILIENEVDPIVSGEKTQYGEIVAQKLIESFKMARAAGIYEDRMMRRVKNFLDKTPVLSDCGGCGLQIVVSPDGKIGVCQAFCGRKEFFVTEPLETFEPESHPFWKQWRKRSPLANKVCRSCVALGNCGGGCPYNAYRTKGTIYALDERFCVHAKATTHFLIRDLWEKQKERQTANK